MADNGKARDLKFQLEEVLALAIRVADLSKGRALSIEDRIQLQAVKMRVFSLSRDIGRLVGNLEIGQTLPEVDETSSRVRAWVRVPRADSERATTKVVGDLRELLDAIRHV